MANSIYCSVDSRSPENPINKFAAYLIRRKSRELACCSGFNSSDQEDIEQELTLVLLKRLDKFDPSVAHYNAFVTTVIERYAATILEHRRAKSRSYRRDGGSLNQRVDDGDGNQVEMGAKLGEDHQSLRTGVRFRSGQEQQSMATDVAQLIAELPPEIADICQRLKKDTISNVARDLKIPRSSLCDLLKRVRSRFESAGMRDYL